MAVTHADLAPTPGCAQLGSKSGLLIVISTILCGLLCFILCLLAEVDRSQIAWVAGDAGKGKRYKECVYSGSGRTPLLCSAVSFLVLAAAMVAEHVYMLVALSRSPPPAMLNWDSASVLSKILTWEAGFFFVSSWACFTVAEILLLIGVSLESSHLRNWSSARGSCLVVRQGMFSAAGVFSLATVFLAAGVYITALRMQSLCCQEEMVRQEVRATSVLFASAPPSPRSRTGSVARQENSMTMMQYENEAAPGAHKNSAAPGAHKNSV